MRSAVLPLVVLWVIVFCVAACDSVDGPLAPYEGERPLAFMAVTASFAPDIQWVGGRAAAVGINRGGQAALDSTLVWVVTADGNALGSPLRVGEQVDEALIQELGGTPIDSLADGEEYTFWVAEQAAFDAGLTGPQADSFSLADSTFFLDYALSGRSGGDRSLDIEFKIVRDQTLTSDRYIVLWTPAEVEFRQVALRTASIGGFTDLLWHVVVPGSVEASITSPLVLGETPAGANEVIPWQGTPFERRTHIFWATTSNWNNSFTSTAPGYAFFQIASDNF